METDRDSDAHRPTGEDSTQRRLPTSHLRREAEAVAVVLRHPPTSAGRHAHGDWRTRVPRAFRQRREGAFYVDADNRRVDVHWLSF